MLFPGHATVPNTVPLIEQLMQFVESYAVDFVNAFFSILKAAESQNKFAFTHNREQWTFQVLPQVYLHSSIICHVMVDFDLDFDSLSWKCFYYIHGIILISECLIDLGKYLEDTQVQR